MQRVLALDDLHWSDPDSLTAIHLMCRRIAPMGWTSTCGESSRTAKAACALFAQLEQWADRTGEADPSHLPWAADAIAAYLACGRPADAQHVLGWVAQRAALLPSRWPKIVVTAGQAAQAEHHGDRAQADECFAQALELHAGLPMGSCRTRGAAYAATTL